jgi:serine/threonine protein kinase/Tfp pilus assembly protein PilF
VDRQVLLEPATIIDDRVEIRQLIGVGGMGSIYRARQIAFDREVAIKFFGLRGSTKVEDLRRFQREAQLISRLTHRNIVSCYGYGVWQETPYIVMELLDGQSLETYLTSSQPLPLTQSVDLAMQVCQALSFLHAHQIIHRDIKPSNVIITPDGTAKMIDFGLAKDLSQNQALTDAGCALGSLHYMSPEQCTAKECDQRSDIYGFGALFFHMLTGITPFDADSAVRIMYKHLHQVPPTLSETKPDIRFPAYLERIVKRCLEKDPDRRYQSVGEIIEELKDITPDPSSGAVRSASTPPNSVPSAATLPRRSSQRTLAYFLCGLVVFSITAVSIMAGMPSMLSSKHVTAHQPLSSLPILPAITNGSQNPQEHEETKAEMAALVEQEKKLTKVIAENPERPDLYFDRACVYLTHQPQRALGELNKAIELSSQSKYNNDKSIQLVRRKALYLRAELKWKFKLADSALIDLNSLAELAPTDQAIANANGEKSQAQVIATKGQLFYSSSQLKKAEMEFNRAIALDPSLAGAYLGRGSCNYMAENFDAAISDFSKVISLDPSNLEAYFLRANLCIAQRRLDMAEKDIAFILRKDKDNAKYFALRSILHLCQGELVSGREDADGALLRGPNDFEVNYWVGKFYRQSGAPRKAIEVEDRALALNPKCFSCYAEKAATLLSEKQFKEAATNYEMALKMQDNGNFRLQLADCSMGMKQYAKAISLLTQVIAENPSDKRLLCNSLWHRAKAYLAAGDLVKADEDYRTVLTLVSPAHGANIKQQWNALRGSSDTL